MKIKLDENLPSRLASRLAAMGHDVQTVVGEGIEGNPDPAVWEAAQREARFLITQDMDFSDARRFAPVGQIVNLFFGELPQNRGCLITQRGDKNSRFPLARHQDIRL